MLITNYTSKETHLKYYRQILSVLLIHSSFLTPVYSMEVEDCQTYNWSALLRTNSSDFNFGAQILNDLDIQSLGRIARVNKVLQERVNQIRGSRNFQYTLLKKKPDSNHLNSEAKTSAVVRDTFEKLEEIGRQINKIKETYKKLKLNTNDHTDFLEEIKESLFRISWRVDEIPSYDKFHMGKVFPEKNWIYLGYLSNVLNDSSMNPEQLKIAVLSLAKEIGEIERALPIIKKKLLSLKETGEEKKKLEEDLKNEKPIELDYLENFVGSFMDKYLLGKIINSINTIICVAHEKGMEGYLEDEDNQRAIFRTFEVIGECAKYVSEDVKKIYTNIPWSSLNFPEIKNSILTIVRNNFHHHREKTELFFKHEPHLFKSVLETVFPYLVTEIRKVDEELGNAYQQLTSADFAKLRGSVLSKIHAGCEKLASSSSVSSAESSTNSQMSESQRILEQIADIRSNDEDKNFNIEGWQIKKLLSYIKEEDVSIYNFLYKKTPLPQTEDNFIDLVRQQTKSFPPEIEAKFRKAYARLQGKKVSRKQIDEVFKEILGRNSNLTIEEIKIGIKNVILGREECGAENFREKFLKPIFFKRKEQKEGEKALEALRARIFANTSDGEEIEKLFELSLEDKEEVEKNSNKALAASNETKEKLKEIDKTSKDKISKKEINKLIGLSDEERITLLNVLGKEPPADINGKEVKEKFSNLHKLIENITKFLNGEKNIDGKKISINKSKISILIHLSDEDRIEIGRIIDLPLEKISKEENEKASAILCKSLKNFVEYQCIYKEFHNKKFKGKLRTSEDLQKALEIIGKIITSIEDFTLFQNTSKEKIIKIFLKEKDADKKEFESLLENLCYTHKLKTEIRKKYNDISSPNQDIEEKLITALDSIDESVTPLNYLKSVLENGWLLPQGEADRTEKDLKKLAEKAALNWEDFQHLYLDLRKLSITQQEKKDIIKKRDEKITLIKEKEKNNNRINKINKFSNALIPQKKLDKIKEELERLAQETEDVTSNLDLINNLYEKKRDHNLTLQDINEALNQLNKQIKKFSDSGDNQKIITIITKLKEGVKQIPLLSKDCFKDLVEKAGYNYQEKFEDLYREITFQNTGKPPLKQLKKEIIASIKKLDSVFEKLSDESLNQKERDILRMSAEYLIEEIGLAAGDLVERKDYTEPSYLSTSKRHLDLISICRKACAHFPLGLEDKLIEYLMDQLILDTRLRLGHSQSNVEIPANDLDFQKNRKITWDELEGKKAEIFALIEGFGFKSGVKIFGKALGLDIGPQGDLNLLVEKYDGNEINGKTHQLMELESRLSKELDCDVRAYTRATLESRLKSKITSEHVGEVNNHATHTLENVILGNAFVRIFQEDRWSSFKTSDGRIFTRSEFLEQQDLRTIFDFLLGAHFSFNQLKDFLDDKETLQKTIQKKLLSYNESPKQHGPTLEKILIVLSLLVPLYETEFQCIYIPVERKEGKITYQYFCPFGPLKTGEHGTIGELPSKWIPEKFKTLDSSMQSLYVAREQKDGSQLWVKCDKIFAEPCIKVHKDEEISIRVGNDIANLLHNKKNAILKTLSPQNIINENKVFKAITVNCASTQKELEKRKKSIETFRKKRLEGNEHLQKLIKDKSLEYNQAIKEQLSPLSPQLRNLVLQYILLDKKIETILRAIYEEQEYDRNVLSQIMDYKQASAIVHFMKHADRKMAGFKTQHINNSFPHFKISVENKLSTIKDEKTRDEIREMLEQKKELICKVMPELLKSQFPASWHNGIAIFQGMVRNTTYYEFKFDPPRILLDIEIPPTYYTSDEAHKLVNQYTAMFFPVRDPEIIEHMMKNLDAVDAVDAIYNDFCTSYCQEEKPPTTFTINEGTKKTKGALVEFSSEIEYLNHGRKKALKDDLETFESLQKPLKELVDKGKGTELEQEQETLSGFTGGIRTIYGHVTALHTFAQRKSQEPSLLIEQIPSFIAKNKPSRIRIKFASRSKSETMYSDDIKDLSHLMQIYGWSEEDKEAYKKNHNFMEDNSIVRDYFDFTRLKKNLDSAHNRKREYEKKLRDLQEKIKEHAHSYTLFQQKKLTSDQEIYNQALEENLKYQKVLKEQLINHPHIERKIAEALRDPDFINDLYLNQQQCSDVEIEKRISSKKEELKTKALNEINVQDNCKKNKT